MPGRMESVENLSRQQYRVRGAVDGFPPFPPPLGNRYAIPTVPQPRRRRYLSYEQETQGDTSIELPRGTFLLGVDNASWNWVRRRPIRWYGPRDPAVEAPTLVALRAPAAAPPPPTRSPIGPRRPHHLERRVETMYCEHLETMSGYLTACRARLPDLPQHVEVSSGFDKKPYFHHGLPAGELSMRSAA